MASSPMGNAGVRQYILETSQGFPGSGIATISGELHLSVVAHMPPPASVVNMPSACYVVYLVDKKGQQGFAAGKMAASKDGVCQFSFQSPVPLSNYTRVIVSAEDPRSIQAYPQGPIVLKVKDDMRSRIKQGDFAKGAFGKAGNAAKRAGGFVQKKAGGLFSRFRKNPAPTAGMTAGTAMPAASADPAALSMGAAIGATGAVAAQTAANAGMPPNQIPLDPAARVHPQNPLPQTAYPQNPYAQAYPQNPNLQTYPQNPQGAYPQNPQTQPAYPQNSQTQAFYPQSPNPQASYQNNINPQGQSQQPNSANPYQQGNPSDINASGQPRSLHRPSQITANKIFPGRPPNSSAP